MTEECQDVSVAGPTPKHCIVAAMTHEAKHTGLEWAGGGTVPSISWGEQRLATGFAHAGRRKAWNWS
ncbi:hypothetical protein SLEP1_g24683 [Rubroshorea leprosula]|uniref:Uncharacterized protein n=1 Tax=Rubroshorea leprosula TaxID=152421 RepID=A0AAV5JQ66_9ROSI|nr:hypothetical protein SLEP1_g24683 [Rubroshorea leprosula]